MFIYTNTHTDTKWIIEKVGFLNELKLRDILKTCSSITLATFWVCFNCFRLLLMKAPAAPPALYHCVGTESRAGRIPETVPTDCQLLA